MSDPQFSNRTDSRFTDWVKAAESGNSDGCVSVSRANDGSGDVAFADDKAGTSGPIQVYDRREWTLFLGAAKAGEFDHI
jgi:hypothetical protein